MNFNILYMDSLCLMKSGRLVCLLLFQWLMIPGASAQQWMPGFSCRKKITIHKSKVEGLPLKLPGGTLSSGLFNFPLLISLEGPELIFLKESFNPGMQSRQGLDIAFASAASPAVALNIQLENYDAANGKLICWVQVPFLVGKAAAEPSSVIYFYYGSSILYDPAGSSAKRLWETDYFEVEHLNQGAEGKIGHGMSFSEDTGPKKKPGNAGTEFLLSSWALFRKTGAEQIILTNDSAGRGGYRLKINPAGNLVAEGAYGGLPSWSVASYAVLQPGKWHYLAAKVANDEVRLYIDGVTVASKVSTSIRLGIGGQIALGGGKHQDRYMNGFLDEVRIGRTLRSLEWIKTEYENQNDPSRFFTADPVEFSPEVSAFVFTFLGIKNTIWNEAANWDKGVVPPDDQYIRISQGKTAELKDKAVLRKLLLEQQAKLYIEKELEIKGYAELQPGSGIEGRGQVGLAGHLLNNGDIRLKGPAGRLVFKGTSSRIGTLGNGTLQVSKLEIDRAFPEAEVVLGTELHVQDSLKLNRGRLYANGFLKLLASESGTAALAPVKDEMQAQVLGDVLVQHRIEGGFPEPSSGRGWRLLSSPVYREALSYDLEAIKQSVFVTGTGGTQNGFDNSPNQAATIYRHDQSLPGGLPQKYVPIPYMHFLLPSGNGFFLFSRGDRNLPDAYRDQILVRPFSNPASYLITYKGKLLTGKLRVPVFNNDTGQDGDGFNLLGNPYASAIRWGDIVKENVSPFLWLYDPVNASYRVSDDPDQVIPVGSGFFVRVLKGFKTGYIVFDEFCKLYYR